MGDRATRPAVLLVAHGTRVAEGRATVDALTEQVRALLPWAEVSCCYVDVQHPRVAEAVAEVAAGRPLVVVPLLLSRGYHVQVDVAEAVRGRVGTVVTGGLGPDPALVPVLLDRLAEAGSGPGDACVLVAAGSRLPEAAEDVERMAELLAAARPGTVSVGYCAAAAPSVRDAVTAVGGPATVLPYLLAPGSFLGQLSGSGATRTAEPMRADPRLAALVVERARQGLGMA